MTDDDGLFEAYRQTHFCADTPHGPIVIRVGQTCPTLDGLLVEASCATWAYITAFNPGSFPLSEAENEARQYELEATVRQLGHVMFQGKGISHDGAWSPEPSILVLGIGREAAGELGRRFGQRAIVCGELGEPAALILCK
jgi:hypothetical protein